MFSKIPWATLVIVVLVLIVALVGGGVVIWGPPGALSFQQYLDDLQKFALAVGFLAIGRGVKAGLENHALLNTPITQDDLIAHVPPPEAATGPAAVTSTHV